MSNYFQCCCQLGVCNDDRIYEHTRATKNIANLLLSRTPGSQSKETAIDGIISTNNVSVRYRSGLIHGAGSTYYMHPAGKETGMAEISFASMLLENLIMIDLSASPNFFGSVQLEPNTL